MIEKVFWVETRQNDEKFPIPCSWDRKLSNLFISIITLLDIPLFSFKMTIWPFTTDCRLKSYSYIINYTKQFARSKSAHHRLQFQLRYLHSDTLLVVNSFFYTLQILFEWTLVKSSCRKTCAILWHRLPLRDRGVHKFSPWNKKAAWETVKCRLQYAASNNNILVRK